MVMDVRADGGIDWDAAWQAEAKLSRLSLHRFLDVMEGSILMSKRNPGDPSNHDFAGPLEKAPEGYEAMDQRRAIKVLLRP